MQAPIIAQIQRVHLDDVEREKLAWPSSSPTISLRRAWPRSADHLTMEYHTADDQLVAGHWMRSRTALTTFAAASRNAVPNGHATIVETPAGPILLQSHGTDRALPALHRFLASRPSKLISIRPERRAVVQADVQGQPAFVKFFRSARHTREAIALGAALVDAPVTFARPSLIQANLDEHWAAWSVVPGRSWTSVLNRHASPAIEDRTITEESPDVSFRVGEALRSFHNAPPPPGLRVHTLADERQVLERWLTQSAAFGIDTRDLASRAEEAVRVLEAATWTPTLIHRDFHDRQVLIADDSTIGLIDFDTLALGDPALDLANALAHIEQDKPSVPSDARSTAPAIDLFLRGYADINAHERVEAWRVLSRLRTRCIHAFRPAADNRAEPLPAFDSEQTIIAANLRPMA